MNRTSKGNNKPRRREHGFRSRNKVILKRRRAKGRKRLTVSDSIPTKKSKK